MAKYLILCILSVAGLSKAIASDEFTAVLPQGVNYMGTNSSGRVLNFVCGKTFAVSNDPSLPYSTVELRSGDSIQVTLAGAFTTPETFTGTKRNIICE